MCQVLNGVVIPSVRLRTQTCAYRWWLSGRTAPASPSPSVDPLVPRTRCLAAQRPCWGSWQINNSTSLRKETGWLSNDLQFPVWVGGWEEVSVAGEVRAYRGGETTGSQFPLCLLTWGFWRPHGLGERGRCWSQKAGVLGSSSVTSQLYKPGKFHSLPTCKVYFQDCGGSSEAVPV